MKRYKRDKFSVHVLNVARRRQAKCDKPNSGGIASRLERKETLTFERNLAGDLIRRYGTVDAAIAAVKVAKLRDASDDPIAVLDKLPPSAAQLEKLQARFA